ncbi:MAG: hypothetical protein RL885_30795 [Planctomycetota bacterium]
MKRVAAFLFVLALVGLIAPAASADSAGRHPGSLLIYPIFDSGPEAGTIVSVANVSQDISIDAHFIYIDADDNWREFNRFEELTPRDEFTIRASTHVAGAKRGFLYVIAETFDADRRDPDSLNYLIGDEIVVDSIGNFLYALDAIPFCAKAPFNSNFDDVLDFDNEEYFKVSDKMYVSSFLGNTDGDGADLTTTLIFVALVGSSDYETRLDLLPYNNNEDEFSASWNFRCWDAVSLLTIDGFFLDSFLKGLPTYDNRDIGIPWTSGWIEIDGDEAVDVVGNEPKVEDPPFVGAVVQALGSYATGHLMHESAEDNPTNGKLDI